MRLSPRPEFLSPTDTTLHAAIRARVGVVGRQGVGAQSGGGVVLAPSPRASGLHSAPHAGLRAALAMTYRTVADANRRAIRFPVGLVVRGFGRVLMASLAVSSLAVVQSVVGGSRKRLQMLRIHATAEATRVMQRMSRRDRPDEHLVGHVMDEPLSAPILSLDIATSAARVNLGKGPALIGRKLAQLGNVRAQGFPFHLLNINQSGPIATMSLQPHYRIR